MLPNLTNTTATIRRGATSGTKQVYGDLYTAVACRIEPASDHLASINEAQFGQLYKVFFDDSVDVATADHLVIDSATYKVRGVKRMFGGQLSHKEALAIVLAKQ